MFFELHIDFIASVGLYFFSGHIPCPTCCCLEKGLTENDFFDWNTFIESPDVIEGLVHVPGSTNGAYFSSVFGVSEGELFEEKRRVNDARLAATAFKFSRLLSAEGSKFFRLVLWGSRSRLAPSTNSSLIFNFSQLSFEIVLFLNWFSLNDCDWSPDMFSKLWVYRLFLKCRLEQKQTKIEQNYNNKTQQIWKIIHNQSNIKTKLYKIRGREKWNTMF